MFSDKKSAPGRRTLSPMADPEAHSTVMEFIDYTEYLHSDITRSLTLIQKLDQDYISCAQTLDELSQEYGSLKTPTTKHSESNSNGKEYEEVLNQARTLRKGMAGALNGAIKDREESVAEASRLYDNVDRHFNRLTDIIHKLQSITIPVRDGGIVDKSSASDDVGAGDTHMRITLRLDGQRNPASSLSNPDRNGFPKTSSTGHRQKGTHSGITSSVGHVNGRRMSRSEQANGSSASSLINVSNSNSMQPQSPDSDSDWDDLPDPPAIPSDADRISTLSDFVGKDGQRFPWFELLPAELAILRKRMKKNSTWQPSEAMMLKQLESLGRGIRGFTKWAKRTNQNKAEVDRILGGTGKSGGVFENALKNGRDNKGMKLNIMKRAKRERERREAAEAAAAAAATTAGGTGAGPAVTPVTGNAMYKRNSISDDPIVVSEAGGRKDSAGLKGRPAGTHGSGSQLAGIKRKKMQYKKTLPSGTVKVGDHRASLPYMFTGHSFPNANKQGSSKHLGSGPVLKLVASRAFHPEGNANDDLNDEGGDIVVRGSSIEVEDDMPIDPNEPTYCICDKISYGVMVGCDNDECPKEWFHMECVGLKVKPSETMKWYCPLCRESLGIDEAGTSKKYAAVKLGKKRRKIFR